MNSSDTASNARNDEHACFSTVLRFFGALDRGDADGCASLMAKQGVWDRQGKKLQGPDGVREAVSQRVASRRTAHTISNLLFEPVGADRAKVTFLLVAYEATLEEGAAAAPVGKLAGIRQCTDVFVREDGAWRIEDKSTVAWMRG
ncbi:nuclear transport factor 2 family protein [Ramlibacter sp.]|uniref:nuclear transport factor 2 family protein n=1 Tax=Ramlibacter sp. TaxID=1917967 RepID=UPI003D118A5D